jgi:2-polyprenyl-3-methyl-5-hydroxy-6-metoxy-1,4-benzoquinol methylase
MSTNVKTALDNKKVQEFGDRLLRDNAASVRCALNYIGDKLGLFKALQQAGSTTVADFAKRTGMQERYLKEWLGAMVSAEYVEYDAQKQTYHLTPEKAAFLADEASPMFSASMFSIVKALWDVTPKVSECFKTGGGVPHSEQSQEMDCGTERFSQVYFDHHLTQEWIPAVSGLEEKLSKGAHVADVGCGNGQSVFTLAKKYPQAEVWGFDNFAPVIDEANKRLAGQGLKNAHFAAKGAAEVENKGKFDFVTTFDVIHDMADPLGGLRAIREMLKPDGVYMMVEMNVSDRLEENINPFASMLYSISTLYCMTVSLAENGKGVGACMGEGPARAMAMEAGFTKFERLPVNHPFAAIYILKRS